MPNQSLLDEYRRKNPESARLLEEAKQVLPGGDTRTITYHDPFPSFIDTAKGPYLYTADGDELLDFLNNYTQAIHGHSHERLVEATINRIREGNGFGAPSREIIEHARLLVERFPSIEKVRYGNSGTEATMNAIRAAIAHTSNEKILKIQGGYHGTHDVVEVAVTKTGREHAGIPAGIQDRVVSIPFNDTDALKTAIATHGQELACFIVEPILGIGGQIPAEHEFLETARDLTESAEIILIFDEVMSSRITTGGAQLKYDVIPDLTALGKYVGGLLPIGVFGGRSDLMNVFHPDEGVASHSGSFNGNPATMASGIASLEALDEGTIDQINSYGEDIQTAVRDIASDSDLPLHVTGDGSLFNFHFTDKEPINATPRITSKTQIEPLVNLYLAMRNRNVFVAPTGLANVSTVMSDTEVDRFVTTFQEALEEVSMPQRTVN